MCWSVYIIYIYYIFPHIWESQGRRKFKAPTCFICVSGWIGSLEVYCASQANVLVERRVLNCNKFLTRTWCIIGVCAFPGACVLQPKWWSTLVRRFRSKLLRVTCDFNIAKELGGQTVRRKKREIHMAQAACIYYVLFYFKVYVYMDIYTYIFLFCSSLNNHLCHFHLFLFE